MTEEGTTPIENTPLPDVSHMDMSESIKKTNDEELRKKQEFDKQYEDSKRAQNYLRIKSAMIGFNNGYEEIFTELENEGNLYHQLEPIAIWNYCKTFYDAECDIAKYFSNANKKKLFEEIIDADKYLPMKHSYDNLQLLQEHVDAIVKFKQDQDMELQRQSLSFLGAGSNAINKKTNPRDIYDAWRRGELSTEGFSSGIDKFYKNRHGANYVGIRTIV